MGFESWTGPAICCLRITTCGKNAVQKCGAVVLDKLENKTILNEYHLQKR